MTATFGLRTHATRQHAVNMDSAYKLNHFTGMKLLDLIFQFHLLHPAFPAVNATTDFTVKTVKFPRIHAHQLHALTMESAKL